MRQDSVDLFIATLVPFAPASVPEGSMLFTFEGTTTTFFTNITVRFTVPNGEVQAPLDVRQDGTARIEGGTLRIDVTGQTGGWGTFTGNLGGVAVEVPVPNVGELPPIAGGPAACMGDQFSMAYTSGVSNAVAYFERQR